MKKLLLKNANVILPAEEIKNASILIEEKKISGIFTRNEDGANVDEIFDCADLTISAGFIDVHNHGAVGADVNASAPEDLRRVSRFLATKGVTAWLPTLVPDADENYKKTIDAIDELMREQNEKRFSDDTNSGARVLGVHYEGVFASEKMCGALRPRFFKTFRNKNEIETLPKLKTANAIHFTTLAPEIENGIDLIKELVKQNWIVSIGHTRADLKTLEKAKQAGAKHLTHFFNAMTGIHHRDSGVAGWGLTDDKISFDIIADGIHIRAEMLRFACRSKSIEKVTLISDSVAPTGFGDGEFEIWGEKVSVANGRTRNERGSIAGSVITMFDAVKMMLSLGFSKWEVSQMASANPAKLIGIEKTHGSIEVGKHADLVVLDEEENVRLVLIGGEILINASQLRIY